MVANGQESVGDETPLLEEGVSHVAVSNGKPSEEFNSGNIDFEFCDVPRERFGSSFLDTSQYNGFFEDKEEEEEKEEEDWEVRTDDIDQVVDGGDDVDPDEGVGGGLVALVLLLLLQFWCGAALSILAPFYTSEAAKKGLTVTMSSSVFATVFILQILFTPLFGRYITSIGSVRLLVAGSICSGLASICFGLLPSIDSVELFFGLSLLMRGITALGESAINTAVYPLARSVASSKYTMTVLSVVETIYGLGTMTGPFFGGLLYEVGGFYLPFLVCGTLLVTFGVLSGLMIYCRRLKIRRRMQRRKSKEDLENDSLIVSEETLPRLKMRTAIQRPGVLVAAFITVLTGMSSQWYQPTLEPFLSSTFGLSAFMASMFLVIDGAAYAIVSPLLGLLLDRNVSIRLLLMFGCLSISVSFLFLGPVLSLDKLSLVQVGISLAVQGIGMAANFIGTLTALTKEVVKEDKVGQRRNDKQDEQAHGLATSIWITCDCIGAFLGSTLGGVLYEKKGWNFSCLTVCLLLLFGLFICTFYSMMGWGKERARDGTIDVEEVDERSLLIPKQPTVVYGSNNNIRNV